MGSSTNTDISEEDSSTLGRTGSLGYQVNHLARLLEQALRVRIESSGVVPGQFAQLLALYEQDGLTQSELTERVRIDQSTMAHTLKRMERDGLVQREQDEADRRRVRVHLTPHAQELRPEMVQAAAGVNSLAMKNLDIDEAQSLLSLLHRVITGLEAELDAEGNRQ